MWRSSPPAADALPAASAAPGAPAAARRSPFGRRRRARAPRPDDPGGTPSGDAWRLSARLRRVAWPALALLALWLLVPVASIAHVEGFSTAILSIAMHVRDDSIRAFDFLYGANLEYFALSRLGAALGVAGLSSVPGISPTLALRLLVWTGLAGLVAATWVLVRRWTGAPALAVAAALLVVPGIVESAYVYNDNVPSAALAVGALAVLQLRRGTGAAFGAGLLFGLATVTRADAVLLGPAVLLVLYAQEGLGRAAVRRGLAFGLGLLLPLATIHGWYGVTYLDVLKASTHTVWLWNRTLGRIRHVDRIFVFLGVGGVLLATLGTVALARRREWARLALLAGVPALANVVNIGKLWEARQLLPLTPMLVALVLVGWESLAGARRAWRVAVAALVLLGLFAPPLRRTYDDGTRVLLGRVWNVPTWRAWQAKQNGNQEFLRGFATHLATRAPGATPDVVISDEFTADAYTHLALQEAGFRVRPAGAAWPACRRTAELWERDGRRVVHVRLHLPFVTSYPLHILTRWSADGAPCMAAVRPDSTFYVEKRNWTVGMFQPARGEGPTWPLTLWPSATARPLAWRAPRRDAAMPDAFVVVTVDPTTLRRLNAGFLRAAEVWHEWAAPNERGFMLDLADVDRALAPQVGFPRRAAVP